MEKRSERTLLRVNEAADIFGCTRQNLYRLIKEKKLKSYKRYGLMLVDIDEVERLKDEIIPRGTPRKKSEKI
jgi:excisionase family DNA binding protein